MNDQVDLTIIMTDPQTGGEVYTTVSGLPIRNQAIWERYLREAHQHLLEKITPQKEERYGRTTHSQQ